MRLRSRLLLMTLLPPLLSLLVFGGIMLLVFQQQQMQLLQKQHHLLINSYAELLAADSSQLGRSQLLQKLMLQPGVEAAALYHLDGSPLDGNSLLPVTDDGNYQQKSVLLPLAKGASALQLSVTFSDRSSQLLSYRLWLTFLILLLAVLAVSGLMALRFTFNISDPVESMITAVRRFRDGDFSEPSASHATGEMKRLEDELNQMAQAIKAEIDRLEASGDIANEDMRHTLEALEVQNIELDMARKETLQASHSKNEFFNSMNHEIRTALNSILGFSRLLGRTQLDEAQLMQLAAMQKGANNLLNIVNNILDHSRLEEKKMRVVHESFSLRALIEELQESMSPLAHEKDIEQITLVDGQLPRCYMGDQLRVRQILANLISNAIKFSRDANVEVRALLESRHYENVTVKIAVSDAGPGLTEEQRLALFQPYNQGRNSPSGLAGSGLGLSICKRLVDEMGGQIRVESEPGKGTTFIVLLPLVADLQGIDNHITSCLKGQSVWLLEAHEQLRITLHQQLAGCAAQLHELPDVADLHDHLPLYEQGDIYVIDVDHTGTVSLDALLPQLAKQGLPCLLLARYPEAFRLQLSPWPDYFHLLGKPATQKMLRDELLMLGGSQLERLPAMNVMVVDDHEGNLKLAQLVLQEMGMHVSAHESAQSALLAFGKQRPELVLMDIYMPEMDGKECTKRMRQMEMAGERTPIYALTAELEKMEQYRLQEIGLDGCLTKPLDEKLLFSLLANLAMQRRPAAPTDELPLFDEALALKRCGGRLAVAKELQEILNRDLTTNSSSIRELAQAADWSTLLEVVHKLHGGTRYCGVPRLERAAERLETALKQDTPEERLTRLVKQLLEQIDLLQQTDAITAFISRTA